VTTEAVLRAELSTEAVLRAIPAPTRHLLEASLDCLPSEASVCLAAVALFCYPKLITRRIAFLSAHLRGARRSAPTSHLEQVWPGRLGLRRPALPPSLAHE
jgi:DNA-binding transcriptional ArsR family regulator